MHRRWLAGLHFDEAVHHVVLEDLIATVEAATERRDRLTRHIERVLADWSLAPVVQALQALRGMALVNAATLVAELDHPLHQPAASYGVSRPGALGAVQRRAPAPGRDHQSRQWRRPPHAD
jgi:hypothetical protein